MKTNFLSFRQEKHSQQTVGKESMHSRTEKKADLFFREKPQFPRQNMVKRNLKC